MPRRPGSSGGRAPPLPRPPPQRAPAGIPFTQSVFDAGIWIDSGDRIDEGRHSTRCGARHEHSAACQRGRARRWRRGNTDSAFEGRHTFKQGSGRLELADDIFTQSRRSAYRDRVWGWHFGKPLVATGAISESGRQTCASVLDDQRALHRQRHVAEMAASRNMLSAAYRQASNPRKEGLAADPTNSLLWRMNPRRLDIEAYRDNLLRVSGDLQPSRFRG